MLKKWNEKRVCYAIAHSLANRGLIDAEKVLRAYGFGEHKQ